MSVELEDKRRGGQRIPGLGLANWTWFAVLDIPDMGKLINNQHTNDSLDVTPIKRKKRWQRLSRHGHHRMVGLAGARKMKSYIVEFLPVATVLKLLTHDINKEWLQQTISELGRRARCDARRSKRRCVDGAGSDEDCAGIARSGACRITSQKAWRRLGKHQEGGC